MSGFTTALEVIAQVQVGTAADWFASSNVIPSGTLCRESDTGRYKMGDGTSAYINLPYAYLNIDYPVGFIGMLAGDILSPGWMFCNGAAVSRSEYAQLFASLGTRYGSGDGTTTFNLPNLQDKLLNAGGDNGGEALAFINYIIRVSSAITTISA